jgi:hypothetical protein
LHSSFSIYFSVSSSLVSLQSTIRRTSCIYHQFFIKLNHWIWITRTNAFFFFLLFQSNSADARNN